MMIIKNNYVVGGITYRPYLRYNTGLQLEITMVKQTRMQLSLNVIALFKDSLKC